MKAKKHLGQNFLNNLGIIQKIVEAAEIKPEDEIVEVGPGLGVLTKALCQKMQKVIQLQCAPIGNAHTSVEVKLNGSLYNGAYEVQGDRLVFTNFLPNGQYNLKYRCQ